MSHALFFKLGLLILLTNVLSVSGGVFLAREFSRHEYRANTRNDERTLGRSPADDASTENSRLETESKSVVWIWCLGAVALFASVAVIIARRQSTAKASSDKSARAPIDGFDAEMAKRHPLKILIADDNITNQIVAKGFLTKLGYEPDVANNGREVLARLEGQNYDLILMDCQMPEMDGFEATRRIRANFTSGRGPRVVALTANDMDEDINLCRAAGMDDFISKPMTLPQLIRILSETRPLTPPQNGV